MRINGKLDYSNNPPLNELVKAKKAGIKGYQGGVDMYWDWNEKARNDQAVRLVINGEVAIVDKQDLLYALRAVPQGKDYAEDSKLWQST